MMTMNCVVIAGLRSDLYRSRYSCTEYQYTKKRPVKTGRAGHKHSDRICLVFHEADQLFVRFVGILDEIDTALQGVDIYICF